MSLTEITAINESYPVSGIDQSSQTFRDNFANIKTALTDLNTAVILVIDDVGDVDTTSTPPVVTNLLAFDGAKWIPGVVEIAKDVTPQLGANLDVNTFNIGDGTNAILGFVEAGTPVNWITVGNAATGNSPIIAAVGSDGAVNLTLATKSTGSIILDNAGGGGTISVTTAAHPLLISVPTNAGAAGRDVTIRAGDTTLATSSGGSVDIYAGLHTSGGVVGSVTIWDGAATNARVARFREPVTTLAGVNYLDFRNASTGTTPRMSATGTDTDIGLTLRSKGTGRIIMTNAAGGWTLKYPVLDATAGFVMKTDGATNLNLEAPTDLGTFTVATLPDATTHTNAYALATNASGGRTIVRSDGAVWKVVVVEGATVTV